MNDNLVSFALPGGVDISRALVVGFGLLEDAGDLVADLSRLQKTTVCEGRIVGCRGGQMPRFVGCIKSASVSAC